MSPAMMVWTVGLALFVGLLGVLVSAGPAGWLAAFPLLLLLPWLVRRSSYAHALLSLLIVAYIGIALAFRDQPMALVVAFVGAGVFLTSTIYVRFAAVERRRAQASEAAEQR